MATTDDAFFSCKYFTPVSVIFFSFTHALSFDLALLYFNNMRFFFSSIEI